MKQIVMSMMVAAVLGFGVLAHATGNGAPSGTHYNLNILGKDNCAGDDLTGSQRHTIQVLLQFQDNPNGILATQLDKRNKIFLVPDIDFHVLDGNACDGDGAAFALPTNVVSAYTVWVRALGKPGGSATMTTCATGSGLDGVLGTADDEIVCSTENVVLLRTSGKQRFVNVTKELTTIALDTDGDGIADLRVPLFDSSLMAYFWNFSNNGLRLAQLRFYPR